MVEQAGGGTGEQVPTLAAGARQFRASDWGGARARAERTARTRAAAGLRSEVLWPPARSWLTIDGHTRAVDESAARRRKENAAAERREARRPRAGDLRRSGDRSARETDHRVRRSAPAPVGALLPLIFGERENRRGAPGALSKPAAQRWLFDN